VLLLIKSLGWLVARTPEAILCWFSSLLGRIIFLCFPRRRKLVLSNLHHAFPGKPEAWRRAIGRTSCQRMVETALLSLATPFLDERRLRAIISATPELLACFAELKISPTAAVMCSPHFAYWEAQTSMPLIVPGAFPEFGIIFRPLDHAAANAFVKQSRERFGMRLLSRKEGFAEALRILRRRGFVGILFDQNAGLQGALTLLFDRVCSTTELPGLLAEKFSSRVYGIYPRRHGFWRAELGADRIAHDGTSASVTLGLNRWLEQLLRDDNLCASWLWAHDRWRNQDMPSRRLRLEAKRDLLAADLAARGLTKPPQRTRIWIRLPNWLGDVVMAAPLIRAIRASRPDAEITLIAKKHFLPLLAAWNIADRLEPLPARGLGYWWRCWQWRGEHVDVSLLFTNSFRSDLEAWLAGARHRFGIVRPGKPRPLLSHAYRLPPDFNEASHHQLELWENFLRHFGLNAPPDRSPLLFSRQNQNARSEVVTAAGRIGLIPGSENNPEKRWPVAHWRALIDAFPAERFVIFGTVTDLPIATAVASGLDSARVEILAGKTDLPAFAEHLAACRLLVTNDTGGMHLANALGVPLVGLFGPTNPIRTGPVFASVTRIVQPPQCLPAGGGALANLSPETVVAIVRELLAAPAVRV
jgi:heptosyltransferase II